MSVRALIARASDGFLVSSSDKNIDKETMTRCKTLLHNQTMLDRQISLESGTDVYHFQKGAIVSVILITPFSYSVMEAFTRIAVLDEEYIKLVGEDRIQRAHTLIFSAQDMIKQILTSPFDADSCITNGELPPRENIVTALTRIKGPAMGISSRVIKKKKTVQLEWREISLLVPLTIMAFIKTIVACKLGGPITVITNFASTAVSFYLVFICVHDLLTTKRLILSSFLLLVLTYGTTMESFISVVFNGVFALLTLANVAHYYLKPVTYRVVV